MIRLEIWLNVFLNHVQSLGFNSQQGGLEGGHIQLKHKIIKKTLIVQKKKKKRRKKIKQSPLASKFHLTEAATLNSCSNSSCLSLHVSSCHALLVLDDLVISE